MLGRSIGVSRVSSTCGRTVASWASTLKLPCVPLVKLIFHLFLFFVSFVLPAALLLSVPKPKMDSSLKEIRDVMDIIESENIEEIGSSMSQASSTSMKKLGGLTNNALLVAIHTEIRQQRFLNEKTSRELLECKIATERFMASTLEYMKGMTESLNNMTLIQAQSYKAESSNRLSREYSMSPQNPRKASSGIFKG